MAFGGVTGNHPSDVPQLHPAADDGRNLRWLARIMRKHTALRLAAALATVSVAGVTLTGCSVIRDSLSDMHEESFSTYQSAKDGWRGSDIPAWIPADATDLHNRATGKGDNISVRVTTDSDPVGECVEEERFTIAALNADWTPEKFPDEVLICGDYAVMPVEDGWFAWTPARNPNVTTN